MEILAVPLDSKVRRMLEVVHARMGPSGDIVEFGGLAEKEVVDDRAEVGPEDRERFAQEFRLFE